MRLRPTLLLVAFAATVFPAPAGADEYCQTRSQPVASVLLIHGGAWMTGSASMDRPICPPLARMGYRVRMLEYPLYTVPGAIAYAREAAEQEARRGRPVYAMGYSAGGSIAEYLAVKSWIDGAVAVAPLSDFVDWRPPTPGFWNKLGMTPEMRRRFSPYHNIEAPAPLRIVHSPDDQVVPYEQSVRMVRRCGRECELIRLPLGVGHASLGSRGAAFRWLGERAAHPRFAPSRRAHFPVIAGARLRPRRFRATATGLGGRAGREPARRPATTLTYELSETARVEVTVERDLRGKASGRCLPRRRPARCPAWRRVGSFPAPGIAGRNRVRLRGRIGGKALATGGYRATLLVTSPLGRRSRAPSLRFWVVGDRP